MTKLDPIIVGKPCNTKQPIAVFIPSVPTISGECYEKRVFTRNTWVSDVKKLNISVYFMVGLNKDSKINEEMKKESQKYKDIIQFAFIDEYYNQTLKTISILRWVKKHCFNTKYIFKADDDILVNINNLISNLNNLKDGIYGNVFNGLFWHLTRNTKYYIPEKYFKKHSVRFVFGLAYLMVGKTSHLLLKTIDKYNDYYLRIEDVFITGIIAEKSGIKSYYIRNMLLASKAIKAHPNCTLCYYSILTHYDQVNNYEDIWRDFTNRKEINTTNGPTFTKSTNLPNSLTTYAMAPNETSHSLG